MFIHLYKTVLLLSGQHLKQNNFFIEFGHAPPSADSRRVVVSYKQKYVHKVLVNSLVKLAQEKVWLGELTVST